jgi:hypothetical protein
VVDGLAVDVQDEAGHGRIGEGFAGATGAASAAASSVAIALVHAA